MELRQLRVFVAAAEELNFRRAAERANITQPALSRHVQHLEAHLGVKLFDRDRRRVTLTPAGALLLEKLRPALQDVDRALSAARQFGLGEGGRLRVGYVSPALYGVMPPVVSAFRAQFPAADVVMRELPNPEQVSALLADQLDVGFVIAQVVVPGVEFTPLVRDPYVVAMAPTHPLAAMEVVPLTALSGHTLISPRRQEPQHAAFMTFLQGQGVSVNVQDAFSLDMVLNFVTAGMGVAFVPRMVSALRRSSLVHRPVTPPLGDLVLGVASRQGEGAALVRAFVGVAHAWKAAKHSEGEQVSSSGSALSPERALEDR